MLERWTAFVPVFLAVQGAAAFWIGGIEQPPAVPHSVGFSSSFGGWFKAGENPIDDDVRAELGADVIFDWSYLNRSGRSASLFVAWFRSQRGGASQPHSPQVCLPANGWTPVIQDRFDLVTSDGVFPVNRYVITQRSQRAVVLYWYQTPRRLIASEWSAKFWTIVDALRDHRTDTALVRVIIPNTGESYEAGTHAAVGFAGDAYPELRAFLPR